MLGSRLSVIIAAACTSLLVMAVACTSEDGGATTISADAGPSDARGEAALPAACSSRAPFGVLTNVPGIDEITSSATLTGDELTLYTIAKGKIATASRKSVDAPFGEITAVSPQPEGDPAYPNVSSDGAELFFAFIPPPDPTGPGFSFPDVYRGKTSDLSSAERLANVNDDKRADIEPFVMAKRLYFVRAENDLSQRIVSAPRSGDGFGAALPVKGLEKAAYDVDHSPVVTADERTIFFSRTGEEENRLLIHSATRSDPDGSFENVGLVSELNREGRQWPVWTSADGCKIYVAVYIESAKKTVLRFARRP